MLVQLDVNDLHRLGVTNFSHKKILMSHLTSLTEHDDDLSKYANRISSVLPSFNSRLDLTVDDLNIVNGKHDRFDLPPANSNRSIDSDPTPRSENDIDVPGMCSIPDSLITSLLNEPSCQNMKDEVTSCSDEDEKKGDVVNRTVSQVVASKPSLPSMNGNDLSYNIAGINDSVKALLKRPSSSPPKKWKYRNGVLTVVVEKATDVDNMDEPNIGNIGEEGWSDPYVQIELHGHYKKERTKVIENEENPVWDERFQLFPENPKRDVLKVSVWDKDKWVRDDLIGKVNIPIIDILNANGHIKHAFDIEGSKTGAKLYLELKYKEMGSTFVTH